MVHRRERAGIARLHATEKKKESSKEEEKKGNEGTVVSYKSNYRMSAQERKQKNKKKMQYC